MENAAADVLILILLASNWGTKKDNAKGAYQSDDFQISSLQSP